MKINAMLLLGAALSLSVPSTTLAAPVAPRAPTPPSMRGAPTPPAPVAPRAPRVVWAGDHGPRLGTQVTFMSSELRDFFGAPEDAGILVQRVEPDSAAADAKVKVGDVLIEIDGHRIERASDVREALAERGADQIEVVVIRKGKRKVLRATIAAGSPRTFVMPQIPEIELPPEVERMMTQEQRETLERELDRAREQLREVERQLQQLSGEDEARPAETKKKTKTKAKKKIKAKDDAGKRKTKAKAKSTKRIGRKARGEPSAD